MTDDTLLAYLAPRFTNRTEDIAVEALGYILSKSEATRCALAETLCKGGVDIDRIARVDTQVTGDNQERPDLAAFDEAGSECVLIEAKFWAKLTDNQPVVYLERLPDDRPSALLFVAPENRLVSLWSDLRQRVDTSNSISLGETITTEQIRSAIAGQNRYLLLTSWRELLGRMAALVAKENAETSVLCDIQQLQGLCERMDSDAFLPLHPDELGPEFPRRWANFIGLCDYVLEEVNEDGLWERTGKKKNELSEGECLGQFIQLRSNTNVKAWLGIHFVLWRKYRHTPLWLGFKKEEIGEQESQALESLLQEDPPELIDHEDGWSYVPIYLKTGVESYEVLDAVVKRLRCVAELISSETN